jgi:hypothetical protein
MLYHIRPPLWSSGQSSCLQIQRTEFYSRRYQIFWEVVGLERGPLSLVSTNEELLERKSSGSGLESQEYGRRDLSRSPRGTFYPQKLVLASPTSGGRSVRVVHSRTQATEFVVCCTIFCEVMTCILNWSLPTFLGNILPPSSRQRNIPSTPSPYGCIPINFPIFGISL